MMVYDKYHCLPNLAVWTFYQGIEGSWQVLEDIHRGILNIFGASAMSTFVDTCSAIQ